MSTLLGGVNMKKGDIPEIKGRLESSDVNAQIRAMTMILSYGLRGVELDIFFLDVLKCGQTEDLKLKKLVYIYLSSAASRHPNQAMLTVNTLIRDFKSPSPLIRVLALRTAVKMGVASLFEFLSENFQDCLNDEDAYVRKCAALCVARLVKLSPEWVEQMGFVETLEKMLTDSNASVVVNVVAALAEIGKLPLTGKLVMKLLTVLSESHEWGRVTILEAISQYTPSTPFEALCISDRITQYLSHANPAVVLTTLKVLLPLVENLPTDLDKQNLLSQLGSPLKTLLSCQSAIQYVAMRNILLVLQKYPDLLGNDVKCFFVKYQDPIYVKLEKLSVMVKLVGPKNMFEVVEELEEYSKEADVEFVKKSVRAIGRCALKSELLANKCVNSLLRLVETDVSYIVESAIIAFRDIFRKFPGKYERAINRFSDRFERIEDPEARAAFIWMLGEYAKFITDSHELLAMFSKEFSEEPTIVQQTLLTAVVKAFLVSGENIECAQEVLSMAVSAENPDLRDRGYIYWRLLSYDPAAARDVILAEKPPILVCEDEVESTTLDQLLKELGTLKLVL